MITIIENFLTDSKVVHNINYSKFWEDKSYYFRKTNYKGFNTYEKKDTVGSYIVARMLEEPGLVGQYPFYTAYGYEYWPTVLLPGMETETDDSGEVYSLAPHSDYDVVKYMETGVLSYPMFGAILYFGNEDVEGGKLRIWNSVDMNEYKEIEPTHNSLVVFDSAKVHGVTEVTKGIRKSIAINFWQEQIMTEQGELN